MKLEPSSNINRKHNPNAIITVIDILGFEDMIERDRLYDISDMLHKFQCAAKTDRSEFLHAIIEKCHGRKTEKMPLHVLCASDMVLRFCFENECTPDYTFDKCVRDEIYNLHYIQRSLCEQGVLLRGGVTIGEFYHKAPSNSEDNKIWSQTFFGKAYNRALEVERKLAIYPRIVLDPRINWNNKNYDRHIRQDFDLLYYIDYLCENRAEFCLEGCRGNKWDSLTLSRTITNESDIFVNFKSMMSEMLLLNGKLEFDDRIFAKYGWLFNHYNSAVDKIKQAANLIQFQDKEKLPTTIVIADFFKTENKEEDVLDG
jgi:hypothetical protein